MPKKLDRCVKKVKADGKSTDSAYAICSDSTGVKRKKGGLLDTTIWGDSYKNGYEPVKVVSFTTTDTMNEIKSIIKQAVREIIQENQGGKIGYAVMGNDKKVVGNYTFKKYPNHQALENAIKHAGSMGGGHVHELKSGNKLGDIVWPDDYAMHESVKSDSSYVEIMRGDDPSVVDGFNYRLTECGIETKKGYNNGKTTLLVRRDQLPNSISTLVNTGDELGEAVGKKLEEKYFKKKK